MKTIKIYQTKHDLDDKIDISFMGYEFAKRKIPDLDRTFEKYYNLVYETVMEYNNLPDMTILEDLFRIFNIERPDDYKGRSMSTSDIVILDDKVYYCDSFGFTKL